MQINAKQNINGQDKVAHFKASDDFMSLKIESLHSEQTLDEPYTVTMWHI
jgi:hypothetical protein